MGVMGFLRNRAGIIIVVAIGFAILAFLIGDGIRLGTPFWAGSQNEVGEVAGKSISYQEFSEKLERNEANMKQQMGGAVNEQMSAYIRENTWKQEVSSILLEKEVNRLGLSVSKNELNDMITGKNPDQQVIQNFGDPKTGTVNREQLNSFLANVSQQPAAVQQQWEDFLASMKQSRLTQKYFNLVKNSMYVTSLEAREDYAQRNRLVNFNYTILEYASVPDAKINVTDGDYKDYYEENKARFRNEEETRTIDYVVFNGAPSKADSAVAKATIGKLASDFRSSKNDSLFVMINSDTKAPVTYLHKGQLDPALDSVVFAAAPGMVVGPVFSNGSYKMAKVLDTRTSPDSVKASHILLNAAAEGGVDKAKAKGDSIAALVRKGANFAELAKKFGTDGSKDKGGDLGTFGRGAMIPAFEDAVFNGKTGDIKVITTQYGVHVIHIDSQKGSGKVVKVAQVDKAFTNSEATRNAIYSKASSFLDGIKSDKDFDDKAVKSGLKKQTAENVTGAQGNVPGVENPREIVQWAYKAGKGDVAEKVFQSADNYIVAKLSDIRKKGTLPLEQVKTQIKPMVINRVKARMLTEKANAALSGATTLAAVAQKLNKPSIPVQNIVFANPVIPGLGQENKVVGTAFGVKQGKLSGVIEGEQGVYILSVTGFVNPPPLTNTYNQKEQMMQVMGQQVQNTAFKVLVDKANIKDNRVKFF